MAAELIDDLSVIIYRYLFVHTILSIPFSPYHFVRYHFVLEPFWAVYDFSPKRWGVDFFNYRWLKLGKLQAPKARSWNCRRQKAPTTRGSGERRKLPQRGLGQSPRNRRNFEHFKPKWSTFWNTVNLRHLRRDGDGRDDDIHSNCIIYIANNIYC